MGERSFPLRGLWPGLEGFVVPQDKRKRPPAMRRIGVASASRTDRPGGVSPPRSSEEWGGHLADSFVVGWLMRFEVRVSHAQPRILAVLTCPRPRDVSAWARPSSDWSVRRDLAPAAIRATWSVPWRFVRGRQAESATRRPTPPYGIAGLYRNAIIRGTPVPQAPPNLPQGNS